MPLIAAHANFVSNEKWFSFKFQDVSRANMEQNGIKQSRWDFLGGKL